MELNFIVTQVLHQLGACKGYSGFDYIIFAMKLIDFDNDYLCFITKSLYIDIAKEFSTSHVCVEKNIRTVVNKIWDDIDLNRDMIARIFGKYFLSQKPSNREFLELLYDYAKNCRIIEDVFNLRCPLTKDACPLRCNSLHLEVVKS